MCAKVVHFEHMWNVDSSFFFENLFIGLCNFSRSLGIPILTFKFLFWGVGNNIENHPMAKVDIQLGAILK